MEDLIDVFSDEYDIDVNNYDEPLNPVALACEVCFSLLAVPLLPTLGALRVSAYACVLAVPQLAVLEAQVELGLTRHRGRRGGGSGRR